MSDHFGLRNVETIPVGRVVTCAAASLVLLLLLSPASPQTSPITGQPTPAEAAAPAVPSSEVQPSSELQRENPGLINELGKLLKNSPLRLPPLKTPQQAIEDFNAGMKGGATGLPRVGSSAMVDGRMKCAVAENGAPDCKAAADTLCRDKGFKEGKSVDTEATQTCSVKALLSGNKSEPGVCRTDNFVTRAMCQ